MAAFDYRPLREDEIRVLKLTSSRSLEYRLVHINLDSKPRYSALSYTWGDNLCPHPIRLNNEDFWITQNLSDALHQLHSDEKAGDLWVDAICINQADVGEKSIQIRKMTKIYECAYKVIVWLGKPENEWQNRLAMRKIQYFFKQYMKQVKKDQSYRPWWWPHKPARPWTHLYSTLSHMAPSDKEIFDVPGSQTYQAWLGIRFWFSCQWWGRTWVYQEATVPENWSYFFIAGVAAAPRRHKVEFLCGGCTANWNELSVTLEVVSHLQTVPTLDTSFLHNCQENARHILRVRFLRLQAQPLGLLELLQLFRHSDCKDPKDKVFAPLGLAPNAATRYIVPNYNIGAFDVYLDVVRFYLTQPGSELNFLGYVMKSASSSSRLPPNVAGTWPSWLPNWYDPVDIYPFRKVLYIPHNYRRTISPLDRRGLPDFKEKTTKVYNATSNSRARLCINGRTIDVAAIYCDTITEMLPVTGLLNTRQQAMTWWNPTGRQVYVTGEPFTTAFSRTHSADVKYDALDRVCGRPGFIDYNLLSKDSSQLKTADLEMRSMMRNSIINANKSRSLCRTARGYIGLMPTSAAIGDYVYAFLGGQVLYAIRKHGNHAREFEYIGECYIHGLMDGEVMSWINEGSATVQNIVLI